MKIMSLERKMETATKITNKQEKQLIRDLQKEYEKAYKSIKTELANAIADYGVDGSLDPVEMAKYDRMMKLQKAIEAELHTISKVTDKQIKGYLGNIYDVNYYNTAYALETEAQAKLAYGVLDRKAVAKTLQTPLDKIALQNNATQVTAKIRSSLAQGIARGMGINDISKLIRKDLEQNANNSVRIARTETTRVMNSSRSDSMEHAEKRGLKLKKVWVATLDDRTRDGHADIDGEEVDIDKPFSNGLMYPGDPAGDAEEVINCRCTMITQVEGLDDVKDKRRIDGRVVPYKTFDDWYKNRVVNSN
jgi:SPP1 gp7 family putative phage head morphogenesis protein